MMIWTNLEVRAARKAGAPFEQLLTVAPLWVVPEPYVSLHGVEEWVAHHSRACPYLGTPGVTVPVRLDPKLRFLKKAGTRLFECGACMPSKMGGEPHPLWAVGGLLTPHSRLQRMLKKATDASATLNLEYHLSALFAAVTWIGPRMLVATTPELAFWADWLHDLHAGWVAAIDARRAHLASNEPLLASEPAGSAWVLCSTRAELSYVGAAGVAFASMCPVVYRRTVPSFVVQAPAHLVDTWNGDPPKGFHLLGPVRPMTDLSWAVFELLLSEGFNPPQCMRVAVEAGAELNEYAVRALPTLLKAGVSPANLVATAAAAAAGDLNDDIVRVLPQLIKAGVAPANLVATAATVVA